MRIRLSKRPFLLMLIVIMISIALGSGLAYAADIVWERTLNSGLQWYFSEFEEDFWIGLFGEALASGSYKYLAWHEVNKHSSTSATLETIDYSGQYCFVDQWDNDAVQFGPTHVYADGGGGGDTFYSISGTPVRRNGYVTNDWSYSNFTSTYRHFTVQQRIVIPSWETIPIANHYNNFYVYP